MDRMHFKRETVSPELVSEVLPLLQAHWEEIAHYKDIELSPDFHQYESLDRAGVLRLFTIRDATGKLKGYSVFFVRKNPHYRNSLQAAQDILFLEKAERGRLCGVRFLKWCDEELKKEGVQAVYHHVKKAHNFGPMLERMGYELVDLIYGRRLDVVGGAV